MIVIVGILFSFEGFSMIVFVGSPFSSNVMQIPADLKSGRPQTCNFIQNPLSTTPLFSGPGFELFRRAAFYLDFGRKRDPSPDS